ncbi:MAG: DUF4245 domain-containing protein [Propionibacteriales bacterium]|nr:DUF4245 domain-containing protein [Propionibacteriales bacterium]
MSETRRGYDRSGNGLVGALLAALLLIAAMFVLTRFGQRDQTDPAPTVGYTQELTAAREDAPFEVLAPTQLPPGWRATTVEAEGSGGAYSWHLGLLVEDRDYVAVDQGTQDASDLIAQVTPATYPGEHVDVGRVRWQAFGDGGDGDDNALVLRGADVTSVVSGTVSVDVLIGFAESLQSSE